jgi:DNA polymerase V
MNNKNIQIFNPSTTRSVNIPIALSCVQAGFPSPADDYLEDSLDLNKYLIKNADSTFFVKVSGESMIDIGIFPEDILIVDKSLDAKNNDIVIAILDNDFTVKRLFLKDGKMRLIAENDLFQDVIPEDGMNVTIWGVVTSVIHKYY